MPKVLIYIHHNKGLFLKNEGGNDNNIEKYNAVSINPIKDLNFYYKDIIRKKAEICPKKRPKKGAKMDQKRVENA